MGMIRLGQCIVVVLTSEDNNAGLMRCDRRYDRFKQFMQLFIRWIDPEDTCQ